MASQGTMCVHAATQKPKLHCNLFMQLSLIYLLSFSCTDGFIMATPNSSLVVIPLFITSAVGSALHSWSLIAGLSLFICR